MINPDSQVILASGEAIAVAEIFEGILLLAARESPWPLLTAGDKSKAVINVAFEVIEWAEKEGS